MALPASSGLGARRPGVAAGSCALLGRTAVLAAVAALAVGAPGPFRLWPASALSGGNLPIQTSAGQSGTGAPACSNARFSRASGSRLGDRCGAGRGGAGEPAASVTVEQHRRFGLQAHPPDPERAAMEHSLHRVSLGSRRAHPGLSFYLTTFGKCPLRPAARTAAPCSQRPERAPPW